MNQKENESKDICILVKGSKRALLKEYFIIAVSIFKASINSLNVTLPRGIKCVKINSSKMPNYSPKTRSVLIERSEINNYWLAVLTLVQEVEDSQCNKEINVDAYSDSKLEVSFKYPIKILIPHLEIQLEKQKIEANNDKGLIKLKIKSTNDVPIAIYKVDLNVYYHGTDEKIDVLTKPMPLEKMWQVLEDFPDEINPEFFIGSIEFNKFVDVDIEYVIKYHDINKNEFSKTSDRLLLNDKEVRLFAANPLQMPEYIRTNKLTNAC